MPRPQPQPARPASLPITEHVLRWQSCQRCPLGKIASQKVFYRTGPEALRPGVHSLPLMIVAEAPAFSEDTCGLPLSGPAGDVTDDVLHALSVLLQRNGRTLPNYAICNTVACLSAEWPDDDTMPQLKLRPPKKAECEACRPRLQEFIQIAGPQWIVMLGAVARVHVPLAVAALSLSPSPVLISVAHPGTLFHKADPEQERPYYVTATATTIASAILGGIG